MHVNTEPDSDRSRFTFRWVKNIFLIAGFLGISFMNVATLVSEKAHAVGYSLLSSVLGSVASDAALTKMLSHSPTVRRRTEVTAATKAIAQQKFALAASHKALTAKYADLEKAHRDVSAKHVQLKSNSIKQAAVVSTTSKKIASRSLAAALRNVSSVAGEAIPFAGAALIIGVTTWDLYDLCETMKDMNEVNIAFGQPVEDHKAVCGLKVPSKEKVMADIRGNWQQAYKTAADTINQGGRTMANSMPPQLSWGEIKDSICPLAGQSLSICR